MIFPKFQKQKTCSNLLQTFKGEGSRLLTLEYYLGGFCTGHKFVVLGPKEQSQLFEGVSM